MKLIAPLLLAAALIPAAPLVTADVLLLDAISENPVNSAEGIPRPRSGQSMDQVRARFGEPANQVPWVGDPPISRWVYDGFTVYFEHDHVITTVIHR